MTPSPLEPLTRRLEAWAAPLALGFGVWLGLALCALTHIDAWALLAAASALGLAALRDRR